MAISINATSSASATNVNSLTFSHTVSGSDTILFVGISNNGNPPIAISGVTYNGSAMTAVWNTKGTCFYVGSALFYIINPTTGTNNVVISWTSTSGYVSAGAVSMTGVHQTVPLGTGTTASGPFQTVGPATTTVSSATGEVVICCCGNLWASISTSETSQVEIEYYGSMESLGISTTAGAASVSPAWSGTGGYNEWHIGAVPVKPAAGGGSSVFANHYRMLLQGEL